MNARVARSIAWLLVAAYFILSATGLYLQLLTNTSPGHRAIPLLPYVIALIVVGIWPVVGARIISHHPRHPVGWLLFATFPLVAIVMFATGYTAYATSISPDLLPVPGALLIWLKDIGFPIGIVTLTLMYLLFPTGRLLSPRWRLVVWGSIGALLIVVGLLAVKPGPLTHFPSLNNPDAVSEPLWAVLEPVLLTGIAILSLSNLAALVSLFIRLRRAQGDEAQQIKWLLPPAMIYWIGIPISYLGGLNPGGILLDMGIVLHLISVPVIVMAVAFAIFKYRLYDIDHIINRTLVYGVLTACVAVLYVLVVGGASLLVQSYYRLAALLITAMVVGVVYRPIHAFFQTGVDRLMYGKRGVPVVMPAQYLPEKQSQNQELPTEAQVRAIHDASVHCPGNARWLRPARAGWLLCMTAGLAVYIPAGVALLGDRGPALVAQLAAVGGTPLAMSLQAGAIVGMAGVALFALVVAAVLFFKRPDDPMSLFLAYFYLIFGFIQVGPGPLIYLESALFDSNYLVNGLLQALLFGPALVILLCIFPDGRFTPPWARRLAIASLVYAPLSVLLFIPLSSSVTATPSVLGVLGWFALFFAGLYAQVQRYRFVSRPLERQQTKWVIYGFGVVVLFALLPSIATVRLIEPPSSLPYFWWGPLMRLCWVISSAALPLTLSIAVLRYRLYDIDLLINRTLVYGTLTACVIGLYVLVVGALGILFQTQGNLLIALLATGIVAVLFQPLRARLQRGINRLIYGERDDPVEALARLGRRLEAAIPQDKVLFTLVDTIAQTLKLPYVAIKLPVATGYTVAVVYGNPVPDCIQLPLIYQGEDNGQLVVAWRSPGSPFSPSELRLLRNIARQAGAAVRTVRLTGDLLRSRQQLVTAREEERRRLRRDLHDGLGATLAALNLEAAVLRHAIRRDPEKAEALVDEFRQDIRATIEAIRHLVYELRPPTLDQLGLVEAVRVLAVACSRGEAQDEATLHITVEAPPTLLPLPAAVEVAAFRIVQEALTNVVTHAQAQHAIVRLQMTTDELLVEVVDDGIGIANGRQPNPGLGLLSMRERAEELGGVCLIETTAEGGARVLASLPLLKAS